MSTQWPASEMLAADEPPPFSVLNLTGASDLVLVCDHASNRIPRGLSELGLTAAQLATHIAWDPGAAWVAQSLSKALDATLICSNYSRLVIDCNRPPLSPTSIPEQSAGILIPGNQGLRADQRALRADSLFWPYQNAVSRILAQRDRPTRLLSIHSFTPVLNGEQRPWQIGVAYYRQPGLARALYTALRKGDALEVGFNQPYAIEPETDYTLPIQGEVRGLPSAMIEIRQDEIARQVDAQWWASRLAAALHG